MMESFSFWARAAVTNGCGRRPMAFGSSARTEATSDASDLNSKSYIILSESCGGEHIAECVFRSSSLSRKIYGLSL